MHGPVDTKAHCRVTVAQTRSTTRDCGSQSTKGQVTSFQRTCENGERDYHHPIADTVYRHEAVPCIATEAVHCNRRGGQSNRRRGGQSFRRKCNDNERDGHHPMQSSPAPTPAAQRVVVWRRASTAAGAPGCASRRPEPPPPQSRWRRARPRPWHPAAGGLQRQQRQRPQQDGDPPSSTGWRAHYSGLHIVQVQMICGVYTVGGHGKRTLRHVWFVFAAV